jgi:excisionase family DNA binding protein
VESRDATRHGVVMGHNEAVSVVSRSEPDLRSTAKTAALLDCSTRTIYRLVERGELAPVRLGRVLRFEIDEIRRYLKQNREAADS